MSTGTEPTPAANEGAFNVAALTALYRKHPFWSVYAVGVVVWLLLGVIPGHHTALAGLVRVLIFLALICTLAWKFMPNVSGLPRNKATKPGQPAACLTMTVGNKQTREAPACFTSNSRIFQGYFTVNYTGGKGAPLTTHIRRLNYRNPQDVERAWEIMACSVLAERARRGYPIKNHENRLVGADWGDDGWEVERLEADDGSVSVVVAYDVNGTLDREDYEAAFKQGLVTVGGLWDSMKGPASPGTQHDLQPLCYVKLRTIKVQEAWSSANPFQPRSTEQGSAQFAWVDQLAGGPSTDYGANPRDGSSAPLGWFSPGEHVQSTEHKSELVYTRGEGHRVIVGPPGSGKFTAAIAPLLLTADTASLFVFDVANGEAARVTAPHRQKIGPVLVLDPFGVSGLPAGSLNPLEAIRADDPEVLHAAKSLTDALFIANNSGGNAEYFNEQAKDVLTSYLLHVATSPTESDRTLRRVREIIRRPVTNELLFAMKNNPVAGGIVSDTAENMIEASKTDADKNTFYVTQTLRANTTFLDLPAVLRATEKSTFDPMTLRQRPSTLYVCLPEQQLGQVGRWLRLVYASVMERVRERSAVPLHVVIDEFPSLGKFSRIKDDMALVRKFGIHIHIATQSLTQLEAVYDKEWQSIMAAARFQQLFGANDHMTAEYFSRRLGKTTRRSNSSSQSRQAGGGSQTSSTGWTADDLMSPDELGRLPGGKSIVLVEGMNPLQINKLHYYEHDFLKDRAGERAST